MRAQRATAIAMALAIGSGGCGTAPVAQRDAATAGRQSIRVTAFHHVETAGPGPGRGFGALVATNQPEPMAGVECTARNDRGSWTARTPDALEVELSKHPLEITCRRDGYREAKVELRCITPRDRNTMMGAMGGLQLVASTGPAAVYALPAVGLVLAAMAGAAALGAVAGSTTTAEPGADVCMYQLQGELRIWMRAKTP